MKLTNKLALTTAGLALAFSGAMARADDVQLYGFMNLGMANTYLTRAAEGFTEVIEGHGGKVVVADGQFSVAKMTNDVDDMIQQQVKAVGILPADGVVAMTWVDKLKENGILAAGGGSIIGFPDEILKAKGAYAWDHMVAQMNSNDYKSGVLMGELALTLLPTDREGKIAIVEGAPGFIANNERTGEFIDGLTAAGGKFAIVTNQPTDWSPENAEAVCQNIITANPDLDIIYTHADTLARGCIHAVEQSGSKVKVLSSAGGAKDGNDMIAAGQLYGSICTKPYTMGKQMAEALWQAVNSDAPTFGTFVTYPLVVVTKDTLDQCDPEW